jgi:hypothetical protein
MSGKAVTSYRQPGVGEPPPGDGAYHGEEPAQVVNVALVEGGNPLVQVAEQVERLGVGVGAVQAALEQAPEVSMPLMWILPSTYFSAWSTVSCA